jgi:BASS family bile acid:Na+ symporter
VPLSVTITSSTTLLSPFVTPFWMKTLAGRLVPVDFVAMMLSIFNMIIIPILAGLAANRLLYGGKTRARPAVRPAAAAAAFFALAAAVAATRGAAWGDLAVLRNGVLLGFLLLGITALAKLVISIALKGPANWMDKTLPVVSMAGICLIIAIITAQSRDQLLAVGPLLILAAVVHNGTGYGLGYAGARLARLDESACRAVAMEVGMQNGGMASGIAIDVLKSTSAALAPAIFGPWMNVSGSLLAGWWRRRPVRPKPAGPAPATERSGSK